MISKSKSNIHLENFENITETKENNERNIESSIKDEDYINFILNEIDNEQNDFNYNDEVKSEQNLSELLTTKIEKQKSNNKYNDKKNKSITNADLNSFQYVEVNGKIYPNDEIQNKEFYLTENYLY